MKKLLLVALLSLFQFAFSQNKGTVTGTLTDKSMNGESLPFANVFIKGTSIGGTTDMDGKYSIQVPAGNQTLVFSFVGYQTIEKPIIIVAGKTLVVNQEMGASEGVALEEVKITGTVSKEKESALLLEQKKATVIKESIGAEELSKKGVSNAAAATTKISGVTKSESSGDVYIRGLGDRYLNTTMNGLPVPSDDVDKKNINLNLFSTDIIQNVGISKTYNTDNYSDQASGNVDIVSKKYTKKGFTLGLSGGLNTNIINYMNSFRRTTYGNKETILGFYTGSNDLVSKITTQGWDSKLRKAPPINYSASANGGFRLGDFSFFGTLSHSNSFNHRTGVFKNYRGGRVLNASYDDTELFRISNTSTAYIKLENKFNDKNKLSFNTLLVNKGVENLYEQGRNGKGFKYDEEPQENGAFVRDQNFKQTTLIVNQLMGKHKWSENNTLNWAGGYNYVIAKEPNRIRNLVLQLSPNEVLYSNRSDFNQRKSSQKINDSEFNALISNTLNLGVAADEYEDKPYSLKYGVNFRMKKRNFTNKFVGVFIPLRDFVAPSVDFLSNAFTKSNIDSNRFQLIERKTDLYNGKLMYYSAFTNFTFKFDNKLSGNLGLRFESNDIKVTYDVANIAPGSVEKQYKSLYPSVNLKYEINDKNALRFASSVTQTLPEFKEIAPFEYISPTGRVIQGNIDVKKSTVYNIDLKYEIFPSRTQLLSATAFYKKVEDPINLALTRGSSGNLFFANTGKTANIYGFELEGKLDLIKNTDDLNVLSATANLTKMWLKQDLYDIYQYDNRTESDLQGASDFIVNASINYDDKKDLPFIATLTANYSSDKIYALGSPESLANNDILFNNEIIEKGFVTLDFVASKEIFKDFTVKLTSKNLLNPSIQKTQLIQTYTRIGSKDRKLDNSFTDVIESYKKGIQLSLGLKYNF